MLEGKNNRIKYRRLKGNREGDILGMPLYLFIIIIITVISMGILLAWLNFDTTIDKMDNITITVDGIASKNKEISAPGGSATVDLVIKVWGGSDPIEGVVVELSGCGTSNTPAQTTGSDGTVTFTALEIELSPDKRSDKISVLCKKSECMDFKSEIIVIES